MTRAVPSTQWVLRIIRFLPLFVSTTVVVLVLSFAFARPALAAFPIPGVGGIVITAPEIDSHTTVFSQSSSQTDLQESWPMAKFNTDSMQFPHGFTMTKTVDVSATRLASEGISKVAFVFTVSGVNGASNAALELSGIQSDQVSFTTGYDANGDPVMNTTQGQLPLQEVSQLTNNQFTNASLNVDDLSLTDFDWSGFSLKVIVEDANGTPLGQPNGSFDYDPVYDH